MTKTIQMSDNNNLRSDLFVTSRTVDKNILEMNERTRQQIETENK